MLWDEKVIINSAKKHNELLEKNGRVISYVEALREALDYKMQDDDQVFLLGQGVDDPGGMFGVTKDFHKKYGRDRSFDTPVSEEGMSGICTGAALCGMRPVYFHNRPDFLLLAFNQIVNHASKLHWMDNGINNVPLTMWAAIGRGWGSGPQHSQAIHGLLMGVPGLKLITPSTPFDAKGLMIAAIEDNNPTIIIEHRWLMRHEGEVPEEAYRVPIGKGVVRREGNDLTIVGVSHAISLAETAAKQLAEEADIDAEVIDLRTVKPLDEEIIFASLEKTGKLLVVDSAWETGGLCAEVACLAAEKRFEALKAPVARVGLPDCPSPAGYALEQFYYPNVETMKRAILDLHKR